MRTRKSRKKMNEKVSAVFLCVFLTQLTYLTNCCSPYPEGEGTVISDGLGTELALFHAILAPRRGSAALSVCRLRHSLHIWYPDPISDLPGPTQPLWLPRTYKVVVYVRSRIEWSISHAGYRRELPYLLWAYVAKCRYSKKSHPPITPNNPLSSGIRSPSQGTGTPRRIYSAMWSPHGSWLPPLSPAARSIELGGSD